MFIIIAILVLAFLIVVHELGHFLVAKWVGIQVDEFSIGFGPSLFSFGRGETRYSFRLLPLGGYVKMAGTEPNDENINGFNKKPLKDRLAVIAAGSVMNFLVAILLFIIVFSFIGVLTPSYSNLIGDVVPGTPAAHAGFQKGDRIIEINEAKIKNWDDIGSNIRNRAQEKTRVVIERNGLRYAYYVTPQLDPKLQVGQIGITQDFVWEKQSFFKAVVLGLTRSFEFARLILQGLFGMVTGAVTAKDIAGPVGITQMIGDAARGGAGYLLSFTAILGINLALVNILPVPALDGSRLLFLGVEGLRGRPIDPEKENFVHLVGFALLMVLFLLITYNDLVRILTGG